MIVRFKKPSFSLLSYGLDLYSNHVVCDIKNGKYGIRNCDGLVIYISPDKFEVVK